VVGELGSVCREVGEVGLLVLVLVLVLVRVALEDEKKERRVEGDGETGVAVVEVGESSGGREARRRVRAAAP
jgi:hypothetical protein